MTVYPPRPHMPADVDKLIGDYGLWVWAKDEKHAQHLVRRRRLGEKIISQSQRRATPLPYTPPSDQLRRRRLTPRQKIDVIHGTVLLAYLAMQSLKESPSAILGDEGMVHLVVHHLTIGWPRKREMIEYLRVWERAVPGYLPQRMR